MRLFTSVSGLAGLAGLSLLLFAAGVVHAQERHVGDSQVVSEVPAPGYPEGIAVRGDRVYVAGPAIFAHRGDAKVWVFDRTSGALVHEYTLAGQDPDQDRGISCVALDSQGWLYVLDSQGRVVRIKVEASPPWSCERPVRGHGGDDRELRGKPDWANCHQQDPPPPEPPLHTQEDYAVGFVNLPPCSPLTDGACSPTLADAPQLPNDIAFGPDGSAYVTDSLQATLWRVPPGGGVAEIWFQDERLDGGFGPNGLRISPSGDRVFFTVSADRQGRGLLLSLPMVDAPQPADLVIHHVWGLGEVPDGIAFAETGDLYVALAGHNQIAVIDPDGVEVQRFWGSADHTPLPVPWDMPANIAFDDADGRLLVTNHAEVSGLQRHFVVFDLVVPVQGAPLWFP